MKNSTIQERPVLSKCSELAYWHNRDIFCFLDLKGSWVLLFLLIIFIWIFVLLKASIFNTSSYHNISWFYPSLVQLASQNKNI